MDWFVERLRQTHPTIDYRDILGHANDFKKLLGLQIIKYSQEIESLPCEWCDEEHDVFPFCNSRDEIVLSCFGNRRILDTDELKIWTVNREVLVKNVNSKNPVIDKTLFEQTAFASSALSLIKKYSNTEELIEIKALGIKIRGKQVTKGDKKFSLNPTDRCLVYFLHYKYLENGDECFEPGRLVLEITTEGKQKTARYIKNRITHINAAIKELVTKGKTSIGPFIKHETGRGYRLNHKFFPESQKNHKN